MEIKINFNLLNECLDSAREIHRDFKTFENNVHQIVSDVKSLFIIFVIGQDDINF
jgi:hypothetical protein